MAKSDQGSPMYGPRPTLASSSDPGGCGPPGDPARRSRREAPVRALVPQGGECRQGPLPPLTDLSNGEFAVSRQVRSSGSRHGKAHRTGATSAGGRPGRHSCRCHRQRWLPGCCRGTSRDRRLPGIPPHLLTDPSRRFGHFTVMEDAHMAWDRHPENPDAGPDPFDVRDHRYPLPSKDMF